MEASIISQGTIDTDFGCIEYNAPRLQDMEMMEELGKAIQKHGIDRVTKVIKKLYDKEVS